MNCAASSTGDQPTLQKQLEVERARVSELEAQIQALKRASKPTNSVLNGTSLSFGMRRSNTGKRPTPCAKDGGQIWAADVARTSITSTTDRHADPSSLPAIDESHALRSRGLTIGSVYSKHSHSEVASGRNRRRGVSLTASNESQEDLEIRKERERFRADTEAKIRAHRVTGANHAEMLVKRERDIVYKRYEADKAGRRERKSCLDPVDCTEMIDSWLLRNSRCCALCRRLSGHQSV